MGHKARGRIDSQVIDLLATVCSSPDNQADALKTVCAADAHNYFHRLAGISRKTTKRPRRIQRGNTDRPHSVKFIAKSNSADVTYAGFPEDGPKRQPSGTEWDGAIDVLPARRWSPLSTVPNTARAEYNQLKLNPPAVNNNPVEFELKAWIAYDSRADGEPAPGALRGSELTMRHDVIYQQ